MEHDDNMTWISVAPWSLRILSSPDTGRDVVIILYEGGDNHVMTPMKIFEDNENCLIYIKMEHKWEIIFEGNCLKMVEQEQFLY